MDKIIIIFVALLGYSQCLVVPPRPSKAALMARYIIHNTAWVSFSTISTQSNLKGYPYVTLKSFSDGPADNGTGVTYMYISDLDVSGKDIEVDNRTTIMASLVEEDYCKTKNFDPQDPRCAKVMITGRLQKVNKGSSEYEFGRQALFEKHPSMKYWPIGHNFYVAKIEMEYIAVLDFFGGLKHVPIDEYFHPSIGLLISDKFPEVAIIDITV